MVFPHSAQAASSGCSAGDLKAKLQEILAESVSQVQERERTALDRILAECNNRCVIFGAGSMGRRAVSALSSIGVQPLAVSDNNPSLWGTSIEGVLVLSPEKAAEQFGKEAVFFIAIRNEMHWYRETFEQLTGLGCAHISSCEPIAWRFPKIFPPFLLYDLPHKLYAQADSVIQAAEIWTDDESRAEYLAQVRLRALGDPSGLPHPAREESYFLEDIFAPEPGESFLDCGAFDGDTIQSLIAHQPRFGAIAAIEADTHSFSKLQMYVATLETQKREKIALHPCAVGAHRGTVRFEDMGSVDSRVSDHGGTVVEMVTIDELFDSRRVSMIKMDIEGAEYDALLGAKHVIQRDRPILAICVYHSQQDLWRLPLLMHSFYPEYRMYLKAYRGDGIQTVAYAVPPERVMGSQTPRQ